MLLRVIRLKFQDWLGAGEKFRPIAKNFFLLPHALTLRGRFKRLELPYFSTDFDVLYHFGKRKTNPTISKRVFSKFRLRREIPISAVPTWFKAKSSFEVVENFSPFPKCYQTSKSVEK